MNVAIANILLGEITSLTWLEKYAGLVRTVSRMENKKKQSFPYAIDVVTGDCDVTTLTDLVPNTLYRSVLYFEEFSGVSSVYDPISRGELCTTELRIVAWLNGKKMTWSAEQAYMSILKLLRALPPTLSSGDYSKIRIKEVEQELKSAAIFSKYTYDETMTQHLMHPHDYMSMRARVEFVADTTCFTDTMVLLDACGETI